MKSILQAGLFKSTCYHFSEIDSTIEEAHRLASQLVQGDCITADYQHKGRGQQGKLWHSSPKSGINLTMFFEAIPSRKKILSWKTGAEGALCVAVAIMKTIKTFAPNKQNICIKWPNDIVVADKKIAGILSEVQKKYTLISCGLNVYAQNWENLVLQRDENKHMIHPVSLEEICNEPLSDIKKVFEELICCIENEMLNAMDKVNEEVNQALWKKNEKMQFVSSNGESEIVLVKKINRDGTLLIEDEKGQQVIKHSGHLRSDI